MNDTYLQNMVGVNFKQNPSLRDRYDEYLQSRSVLYILHFSCFSIPLPWVKLGGYRLTSNMFSPLTCSSGLLLSTPSCLVAKVFFDSINISPQIEIMAPKRFLRTWTASLSWPVFPPAMALPGKIFKKYYISNSQVTLCL